MKYYKYLLLLSVLLFGTGSCMDDPDVFDPVAQLEADKELIREYVAKNYPNAVEHVDTGIWYELLESGQSGSYVYKINQQTNLLILPIVTVRFKMRLLSSEQIVQEEDGEGVEIELTKVSEQFWLRTFLPRKIGETEVGGLLEGGLQVGAKIRVFTPSFFAYGNQARAGVPPNSPLFYEIEVLAIRE